MEELELTDPSDFKDNSTVEQENIVTPKSTGTKRPRSKPTIRDVLETYREQRQVNEERKSEYRENFLKAYNRRTEALERKNTLLELLIHNSQNGHSN